MQQRFALHLPAAACLALAAAAFAAPASAAMPEDWGPELTVDTNKEFRNLLVGVAAPAGQSARYFFRTPAGATAVAVEFNSPSGTGNIVVRRDLPTATPACERTGENTIKLCTLDLQAQTQAAIWYVELPTAGGFHGAELKVSFLPAFTPLTTLPGVPLVIADRLGYDQPSSRDNGCLQTHRDAAMPVMHQCMPVGDAQAWRFRARGDQSHRIENAYTGRCLAPASDAPVLGTKIVEAACNDTDAKQGWRVSGGAGALHFVTLRNTLADLCLERESTVPGAKLSACAPTFGGVPGWNLRDALDRAADSANEEDGPGLRIVADLTCFGDDGNTTYLGDCSDRTTTRHLMFATHWLSEQEADLQSGDFHVFSARDPQRCMSVDPGNAIAWVPCNGLDATQRWSLEQHVARNEWQLRSAKSQQCVVAKDGVTALGTPLVMAACGTNETTVRWRYLSN